jgi:hypothetical protein
MIINYNYPKFGSYSFEKKREFSEKLKYNMKNYMEYEGIINFNKIFTYINES